MLGETISAFNWWRCLLLAGKNVTQLPWQLSQGHVTATSSAGAHQSL